MEISYWSSSLGFVGGARSCANSGRMFCMSCSISRLSIEVTGWDVTSPQHHFQVNCRFSFLTSSIPITQRKPKISQRCRKTQFDWKEWAEILWQNELKFYGRSSFLPRTGLPRWNVQCWNVSPLTGETLDVPLPFISSSQDWHDWQGLAVSTSRAVDFVLKISTGLWPSHKFLELKKVIGVPWPL